MAVVGPAEVCGAAVLVVGGDGGGTPWGKSLVHSEAHCKNHMGGQIQTPPRHRRSMLMSFFNVLKIDLPG